MNFIERDLELERIRRLPSIILIDFIRTHLQQANPQS